MKGKWRDSKKEEEVMTRLVSKPRASAENFKATLKS